MRDEIDEEIQRYGEPFENLNENQYRRNIGSIRNKRQQQKPYTMDLLLKIINDSQPQKIQP